MGCHDFVEECSRIWVGLIRFLWNDLSSLDQVLLAVERRQECGGRRAVTGRSLGC